MSDPPGGMSVPQAPGGAVHRFSHQAMAATFEVIVAAADRQYAAQAAAAAFDELDRLELALSRFIASSDVGQINAAPGGRAVGVGPDAFECLQLARRLHRETAGAFDVTVGALRSCWRADDGSPRRPGPRQLADALARVGMDKLAIDDARHAATPLADGLCVDLGAIGKGYALDRMAELLADWSIDSALLQGGGSTVLATGPPPVGPGWAVEVRLAPAGAEAHQTVHLRHRALSGSGVAIHGRHIIDPRTGRCVEGRIGAWAAAPSAGEADALSTAFMVMRPGQIKAYCSDHAGVCGMLTAESQAGPQVVRFGLWPG